MSPQIVLFEDLGKMGYQEAWDYQEKLLQENTAKKAVRYQAVSTSDNFIDMDVATVHHLLFVEHPPVYTLGKSGKMEHVLIDDELRSSKGIDFFKTNRGG